MATLSPDPSLLRVSTREIPESDRTPFWREVFARQMCHLEFEPLSDGPLDVEATLLALPGLSVGLVPLDNASALEPDRRACEGR